MSSLFGLYFTWSAVKYALVTSIALTFGLLAWIKLKAPIRKPVIITTAVAWIFLIAISISTGATVYNAKKDAWNPPVLEPAPIAKQVDKKETTQAKFDATVEKLELSVERKLTKESVDKASKAE